MAAKVSLVSSLDMMYPHCAKSEEWHGRLLSSPDWLWQKVQFSITVWRSSLRGPDAHQVSPLSLAANHVLLPNGPTGGEEIWSAPLCFPTMRQTICPITLSHPEFPMNGWKVSSACGKCSFPCLLTNAPLVTKDILTRCVSSIVANFLWSPVIVIVL